MCEADRRVGQSREDLFAGTSCGSATGSEILWTSGTGAHEVQGCINKEYLATDGPGGPLGYPTTDEQPVASGRENLFAGTNCTSGPYQGSGSGIYFTPATGAHEVQGCINQLYQQRMGGPGGTLGFPATDETEINGGAYNTFNGTQCADRAGIDAGSASAIYWNAATGAPYEMHACIYQQYIKWTQAAGLPTSSETEVNGGAYNTFSATNCTSGTYQGSGSAIYWNLAAGEAYWVKGCIYQKYIQGMGGPNGILGLPNSGEAFGPQGGAYSTFSGTSCSNGGYQGSGSGIFWNAVAGQSYEVQGCIFQAYMSQPLGRPEGELGMPVSDEYTNDSAGDRESDFTNGGIIWIRATGKIEVVITNKSRTSRPSGAAPEAS